MIKLKKKPVDGHEIIVWRLRSFAPYRPVAVKYVYHKSTPWKKFCDDGTPGVDIVDQWMIYEDGHCVGRNDGWAYLPLPLVFFETLEEARRAQVRNLTDESAKLVGRVSELELELSRVRRLLPR